MNSPAHAPRPLRALLGVPAPAKLNWFLHVLGRRADGLHDLQTVFQFIDWCDEIDFELREDGGISRDGGDGLDGDDLCVRAARALQRHSGCGLGVHMRLRKHIPMQAGLGGGSSDAASVLLALNRLWGLGLRRGELQALGESLGADVPVFVFGRGAFAEGSGTRLRALELPCWRALVAWPGAGLSTAQVFAAESLTRNTPARTMEGFCEHLKRVLGEKPGSCREHDGEPVCEDTSRTSRTSRITASMAEALGFGRNDLQGVALELLPQLTELGRWLERRCGAAARMSGSGSAMFAPWPGDAAVGEVPGSWSVRVCKALSRHPLLHWAAD